MASRSLYKITFVTQVEIKMCKERMPDAQSTCFLASNQAAYFTVINAEPDFNDQTPCFEAQVPSTSNRAAGKKTHEGVMLKAR